MKRSAGGPPPLLRNLIILLQGLRARSKSYAAADQLSFIDGRGGKFFFFFKKTTPRRRYGNNILPHLAHMSISDAAVGRSTGQLPGQPGARTSSINGLSSSLVILRGWTILLHLPPLAGNQRGTVFDCFI